MEVILEKAANRGLVLTELHGVERSHIATERLHREHGDLITDISRPRTSDRQQLISRALWNPAK